MSCVTYRADPIYVSVGGSDKVFVVWSDEDNHDLSALAVDIAVCAATGPTASGPTMWKTATIIPYDSTDPDANPRDVHASLVVDSTWPVGDYVTYTRLHNGATNPVKVDLTPVRVR